MKLKIKFAIGTGNDEYSTIIEVEEETLSHLIKDEIILKIFKEEKKLEKEYNKIMYIKGIEDIQ
jgi:hypothetical protein